MALNGPSDRLASCPLWGVFLPRVQRDGDAVVDPSSITLCGPRYR
jgi:hypothetical protein